MWCGGEDRVGDWGLAGGCDWGGAWGSSWCRSFVFDL